MTTDPVYGLLQLGELDLALPLSALREVVPRPATLTPLPVTTTGLVGAMGLRSMVLPVLDLRPLLGLTDAAPADQVIVVVAHDHQVLGLVADRVLGVTRVPDADLVELSTASGELLVSHAFQHEDPTRPVSVLAADHLLGLPGVPRVPEQPAAVAAGAVVGTGQGESLTLVRCGDQVLALEVDSIHTTVPLTDVRRSMLASESCLGVTTYAGREVAVVDPMSLVGLPPIAEDEVRSGVVLDLGPGYVVLAVTDLVELRSGDEVLAMPGFAHHRADLVRGVIEVDAGACLVLDAAGLRAEPALLALASVNVEVAGAVAADGLVDVLARGSAAAEGAVTGGPAHLTYTAGVALASPLEQVAEILPYAEALTPSPVAHVAGFLVHRGRTVPVVPLARVLGQEPGQRGPSSCLLLVELGEERVAFAVDSLGGIEPLVWTDPDHRPGVSGELTHAVQDAPLVRLAGGSRLVPALDLQELAGALGPGGPLLLPAVQTTAA